MGKYTHPCPSCGRTVEWEASRCYDCEATRREAEPQKEATQHG